MAAHLEGKGASVLDFTGFAQKFGPVLSYLRLASHPAALQQVRTDAGAADALIGCDLVVSSSAKASTTYRPGPGRWSTPPRCRPATSSACAMRASPWRRGSPRSAG